MAPVLELEGINFVREQRQILCDIDLRVEPGQRWLILGANGSGKSSLLRIAALALHPSSGSVTVVGDRLGRTDVRQLRRRIGWVSAALAEEFRRELITLDVVMTARFAALEPWWHHYGEEDRRQAESCLEAFNISHLAGQPFGTLSSGERQRVLLARSLMNDPAIILLDEPAAQLDLGARERLIESLDAHGSKPASAPFILVTHHVDEIPSCITHALLLKHGTIVSQGPIDDALSSETLSRCYEMDLKLERRPHGRFSAWVDSNRR
jgi:iron complex transport system ATP-binding protein